MFTCAIKPHHCTCQWWGCVCKYCFWKGVYFYLCGVFCIYLFLLLCFFLNCWGNLTVKSPHCGINWNLLFLIIQEYKKTRSLLWNRFEPCDGDLRRHYDVRRPNVRYHVVVADGFPSLSKKDSLLCWLLAKDTLISHNIEFCDFIFVRGRPTRHWTRKSTLWNVNIQSLQCFMFVLALFC